MFHGWIFDPDGDQAAADSTRSSTSLDTGSSLNPRTARRLVTASYTSMIAYPYRWLLPLAIRYSPNLIGTSASTQSVPAISSPPFRQARPWRSRCPTPYPDASSADSSKALRQAGGNRHSGGISSRRRLLHYRGAPRSYQAGNLKVGFPPVRAIRV